MSARSTTQSASGSLRGSIKFAGEEAKDRMYEPKHNKKVVRVLTVIAYVFSVSLAAIMLSMYYIFIWQGPKPSQHPQQLYHNPDCRPSAAGGVSYGQMINVAQPPPYNDSQIAETPRALPAVEELSTTPLSRFAQQYLERSQKDDNYTLPVPVYS